MQQTWGPTPLGRLFTSSMPWALMLEGEQFSLKVGDRVRSGSVLLLDKLTVHPGAIWAAVEVRGANGQLVRLDGIPNARAGALKAEIDATVAVVRRRMRVAELVDQFGPTLKLVLDWVSGITVACTQRFRTRGWLSHEFTTQASGSKPSGLEKLLAEPELAQLLERQPKEVRDAVTLWRSPFPTVADELNTRHLNKELVDSRPFFDTVEKSPLTKEQSQAVINFDSRVLLVASAGSGKTSTMVAKAAYALKKGYFPPDRMLLLAFNNDAAAELRERIKARLSVLGLSADQVVAKTFHAFGLDVIGKATGKRPSLAPWVETGRDQEALLAMVDELKSSDAVFRAQWDMFRLVFGQDLPKFGREAANPEAWDKEGGRDGFWTLNNEVVRSRGELVIANWLFYNGVQYVYEGPYEVDTADSLHRQYRPDFYLPDADAYLEHWALDANGAPPAEFEGYREGMAWKKRVHAENGTRLLETTMADLWSGRAFGYLERELTKLGIELDPNPDREVRGRQPIESPRLARTMRSFLTHAKSNRLTIGDLRRRLEEGVAGQFRHRHEMFLGLFEKLWTLWEQRLRAEKVIDFEDMLNTAAECLERGSWESPYELVMVDEFQDASQARARIVSALVSKPGRHLFAVGDDWQSINRFAGADLGVMTDFERRFGKATILKLETTFRCPQSLCDISSTFVQKNPNQLRKAVRSPKTNVSNPVRIVSVLDEGETRSAVEATVGKIAGEEGGRGKVSVYLLGRYRRDEGYLPRNYDKSRVDVQFITVHSSKGLEADHVIVPRVTSETLGFPSRVEDDAVLLLAMPGGDSYEYAEERRLFYVAMTRARRTVTLVTVARKESAFISELVRDHGLTITNVDGEESTSEVCPKCGIGFLVPRTGPYGSFLGCSSFPRCRHKRNDRSGGRQSVTRSRRRT
ncbi:MAG: UvrD-helicase domain-containing protein [Rubrivivax sp.]|nr:UvrD-helicase domain-containing protein [Rubrivivax sp.]